jgi:hypothetical protein
LPLATAGALARDRSAARARRISENRSLPALQMVSMPKPETVSVHHAGDHEAACRFDHLSGCGRGL